MEKEYRHKMFDPKVINQNILAPEHFHKLFSKKELTFSQKASDTLTSFIGSWKFIFIFLFFLLLWISVNVYLVVEFEIGDPFDPYPFVFLNLILAAITSIQAPIIMMSQNRQAERERIRAEYDYAINRKTEKEVREIKNDIENIKQMLRGRK
ncbi:MAG: DUF1003 domain-containing protein [Candidatus Pacearchaeota archaeon]|jgi:uncharacterized membrane protein